jgi:hypothetical protein
VGAADATAAARPVDPVKATTARCPRWCIGVIAGHVIEATEHSGRTRPLYRGAGGVIAARLSRPTEGGPTRVLIITRSGDDLAAVPVPLRWDGAILDRVLGWWARRWPS